MKSEPNRPGENPQFDERANEDGYFAAKEHELIERMKAEFKKVEAATREKHAQTCPKCSGKLENYRFMDFVLDRCERCEGIWLDNLVGIGRFRGGGRRAVGLFVAETLRTAFVISTHTFPVQS